MTVSHIGAISVLTCENDTSTDLGIPINLKDVKFQHFLLKFTITCKWRIRKDVAMQVLVKWPKDLFVHVSGSEILICVSVKQ